MGRGLDGFRAWDLKSAKGLPVRMQPIYCTCEASGSCKSSWQLCVAFVAASFEQAVPSISKVENKQSSSLHSAQKQYLKQKTRPVGGNQHVSEKGSRKLWWNGYKIRTDSFEQLGFKIKQHAETLKKVPHKDPSS